MARVKTEFMPETRMLKSYQVANILNMGPGTFSSRIAALNAKGFPQRDEFLGGWDGKAVQRWLDDRSGLLEASSMSDVEWMEALNGTD